MNFYAVLSLPVPSPTVPLPSPQTLKEAYRRALLTHHPDKSTSAKPETRSKPRIDEISLAYRTLSSPLLRAEHDRELRLRKSDQDSVNGPTGIEVFHTGLDTVDLDDLDYDDSSETWYRACRCGQGRGFVVDEAQLEKAVGRGESDVLVGCRGCSLWLKVLFGIVEESPMNEGGQTHVNGTEVANGDKTAAENG